MAAIEQNRFLIIGGPYDGMTRDRDSPFATEDRGVAKPDYSRVPRIALAMPRRTYYQPRQMRQPSPVAGMPGRYITIMCPTDMTETHLASILNERFPHGLA